MQTTGTTRKEYFINNKTKLKEVQKEYYLNNKEIIKEQRII